MNEVADRLHARPSAIDAAEVPPGEIGKQIGFAISARPKEWQRVGREFRHRHCFRSGVDLIRAPVGVIDAIETQRSDASRRRQPPDDVSAVIDKALSRYDRRKLELRFLGDSAPDVGMDIHHRQDGRRRLHQVECDIEAVADKHFRISQARGARNALISKWIGSDICSRRSAPFARTGRLTIRPSLAQPRERIRRRQAQPFAAPAGRPDPGHGDCRGAIPLKAG